MRKLSRESPLRFLLLFLGLFLLFYYFNVFFFSITSHGGHYIPFFDEHLNYIRWFRHLLLYISKIIINWFGFHAINNDYQLLVAGHRTIDVVYSCLGLGVMSFFAAFVIAYPRGIKPKMIFLFVGLACIQVLNVLRFILLALFWNKKSNLILDHHTVFNIIIYIVIAIGLYIWVTKGERKPKSDAKI